MMSCRLWLMLICVFFPVNVLIMSSFQYLQECFVEKRLKTALHGYNDLADQWTSDFDCFDRCLRVDSQPCRSFEHWRSTHQELCIRTNFSLSDESTKSDQSASVDYYEILCQSSLPTIKPVEIDCSTAHLTVIVQLNEIRPENVFLGEKNCTSIWSNRTHLQFVSQFDQCSLILINGSIIGKLRWQLSSNNEKFYERFFLCSTDFFRANEILSATVNSSDDRSATTTTTTTTNAYRILLEWILHNRSYFCPETCWISLHSFVHVTFDHSTLFNSNVFLDSCDLQVLHPYSSYAHSRRLIHQGCSTDPTIIQFVRSSRLSFSFNLYQILKEPIPFLIQCRIFPADETSNVDCPSKLDEQMLINKNSKRNDIYTLFRSSPVYVSRHLSSFASERDVFQSKNSLTSMNTVHSRNCYLFISLLLRLISNAT